MKLILRALVFLFISVVVFSCSEKNEMAAPGKSNKGKDTWPPDIKDVQVDPGQMSKRNYYIILDGSGSMSGNKIKVAKVALKKFISLIPVDTNIALTVFDKNGNFERAPFGATRTKIDMEIDRVVAGGNTPLGKSIEIAHKNLGIQSKKQLGYGEYNLVIITDGQATDEGRMNQAVRKLLAETPIVIHTIGFQIGKGHPLNQPGKIYYKTAKNFDELSRGLEEVLGEIEDFTVKKF